MGEMWEQGSGESDGGVAPGGAAGGARVDLPDDLADSIGLDRYRVAVVPHDPRWARAFNEVKLQLEVALAPVGDLRPTALDPIEIEHVGSTAVPGLVAKPILDIALGLPAQVSPDELIGPLAMLGFQDREDLGAFGGRLFVAEWTKDNSFIHAHVVARSDDQWDRYLAFRDGLRSSPELAAAYAELKTKLAAEHADDRAGYTAAKFGFVLENAEQLAARRRYVAAKSGSRSHSGRRPK